MRKITNKLLENIVIKNIIFLSLNRILNIFLPLITLPYITRVLGSYNYGLLIYSSAIMQYFVTLTNFGFNLAGTNEISVNRHNIEKRNEIFSAILIIKILLLLFSFLLLYILISNIKSLFEIRILLYITFYQVVSNILLSKWIFQGIEKMKYLTIINYFDKCFYIIYVFVFIHKPSDYIYIPILAGISKILLGFYVYYILIVKFEFRFRFNYKYSKQIFKKGFSFFTSRIFITLYTSTTKIIIGHFFSMNEVGYYNIANKLIGIVRMPINLLNTALFPNITKSKNFKLVKKVIIFSFIYILFSYILVFLFGKNIITLVVGDKYIDSYNNLIILMIKLFFVSIHIYLGSLILIPLGFIKIFNNSVIWSTIAYLIIILFMIIFDYNSFTNILFAIVSVDLFILIYRFISIKKLNLLNVGDSF